MKYLKYILSFFLILLLILGLSVEKKHQKTEYLLDTVITLTAYGKNADTAITKAFDEIKRIDGVFSAYSEKSEIHKINQNAAQGFVNVSDEVFYVLKTAVYVSEKTNGAFDITLKPVCDLWDVGGSNQRIPKDDEIKEALKKTGYADLELDEKNKSIRFKKSGMAIDLGAIAKGYASDRAVEIFKNCGVKNAVLDLGGNIAVIGKMPLSPLECVKYKNTHRPFVIGIQNPSGKRGDVIKSVSCDEDMYIITSGGYERYFEENGKRYHHIIDPKTGMPAESGILSATVISKSGILGDAYSTAAFVLGENAEGTPFDFSDRLIIIDSDLNIKEYGSD